MSSPYDLHGAFGGSSSRGNENDLDSEQTGDGNEGHARPRQDS